MAIPTNEIVKLVNEHSGLVLEIEGEATTEGTRAEQYTDANKDHQWWRLKPAGSKNDGFYNIENVHSAMSLEVVESSKEPGADIVQRLYGDGPPHRQWELVPVAGKTAVYKIVNRNSGLVLDDVGGQTKAPAPVKQYRSWDDDGRQQWQLITVSPDPDPELRTARGKILNRSNKMTLGTFGAGTVRELAITLFGPGWDPGYYKEWEFTPTEGGRFYTIKLADSNVANVAMARAKNPYYTTNTVWASYGNPCAMTENYAAGVSTQQWIIKYVDTHDADTNVVTIHPREAPGELLAVGEAGAGQSPWCSTKLRTEAPATQDEQWLVPKGVTVGHL